jgi:hypothetical protein
MIRSDSRRVLTEHLAYQTAPGVHTTLPCECGGRRRPAGAVCAQCIDAELLRRAIDVTKGGTGYGYERVGGRVRRAR